MESKIKTDKEILDDLLKELQTRDNIRDAKSLISFVEEERALRHNFSTLQEAIEEADICLQLIAKRAVKYGEAWKDTRLTSITDYVTMKYHRLNKMVDNPVQNRDKIESDLRDMINYGLFSLIKLHKETKNVDIQQLVNINLPLNDVKVIINTLNWIVPTESESTHKHKKEVVNKIQLQISQEESDE